MGSIKPLAAKLNSRLVVVSNRGSCTFVDSPQGIKAVPSVSGLVSAVEPVVSQEGGTWVAWGGRCGREGEFAGISVPMPENGQKYVFQEVLLTPEEVTLYYEGFNNGCLWPLCHNFVEKSVFNEEEWQAYRKVNEKYAAVLFKCAGPRDLFWVHDYHLAILPAYIRRQRPYSRVSLFWHIPFPPAEIFAVMPWAEEMLKGMLEAELIGFHSRKYVRNFLHSAEEIAGAEVDYSNETVYWSGRQLKAVAAPIGINWLDFEKLAGEGEVVRKAAQIRQEAGGEYLLLGVDRLDYTKGILERLRAIEWLLENYPQYRNRLTFLQIAVPSRTGTAAYQRLKRRIEEAVGRINGKYTENYRVPVKYLFRSLSKPDLVAHYLAADMALVTPLKDGLNLVAKEYVASNAGDVGVLLLSPFAGAAGQLKEALTANPYNPREMAARIVQGLEMPVAEKKRRLAALSKVIREQDIHWWWRKVRQSWFGDAARGKVAVSPEAVQEVLRHGPVAGLAGRDSGATGSSCFMPPEIAAND
ncbi:MAG: trehalose-6-phosphate synthase [Pelotomaculum sp.]|uniref:Trehalose-6-phosphate synthase n=1 Tax=Pelotomaculum thermopropionicum (strain DSM 13744 / JCM 10971 / SI) TaxID=370438 RepID=A5D4V4_PELTS|nr:trehalose-6-phosphate synthase [Pelotomaculum sp.]BAF58741.1 trehalose-6-phosphate synthase [Pelotomaculum thermopropionicum SI]